MADLYGVRITPTALKDLEAIFAYVEAQSPQNARLVIRRLLDAIDGLERMPGRFNVPRTGYVRGRQVRSMPVPPYLVRYRIDERRATVHVLRVRHGARRRP